MIYEYMGIEEVQRRYSRVIHMLRTANQLTLGESVGCLLAYFRKDEWAGEAVNHAGGVMKCMNRALRMRKVIHGYPRKSRMAVINHLERE